MVTGATKIEKKEYIFLPRDEHSVYSLTVVMGPWIVSFVEVKL